ncbi:protein translocase subunit SecA [Arenicella chitinivorans]|uniref:Protein translocase subunit SecA n=1 Tax=Arenicella chitinivorans TaxID=1329800 RepID=A0A918RMQ7_9GAMM|nr:preprotein translocase subunit SecA [Arenicella chitinivorans]GHA05946.1 protein translocase subunit SecA [Arenicella chitinivorans]
MFKKIFGSRNDRLVRQMSKRVKKINDLEPEFQALSDEDLKSKTTEFRQRLDAGETLDAILNEAFATVREASVRALGMRHYDVQMIGGMVLHDGRISEMRTGEGKTLMATLAAYLNALAGTVHVVTVNDYLAARDAEWMAKVYNFMGLTVGTIRSGQSPEDKQAAYACDIVYGTNNEFGFDYLRDNMAFSPDQKVQRELTFAIVDEVDSILIDEARTPLIISGPADTAADVYSKIDVIVPQLTRQEDEDGDGDYTVDEKSKQAYLTEAGHEKAEQLMVNIGLLPADASLYDIGSITLLHHLYAAIRAHTLFHRDVDYVIEDNQIVIVDEFTGRKMPGRRWSDGLHQAIEAKEKVAIQRENQTLASITFQNYFRLYDKLSGMTGTADTEAVEFMEIYGLEVVVIPTHKTMVRMDQPDVIFRTMPEKFAAIVEDVRERNEAQQPVLLGTASIEVSELLSREFKKHKIKHEVLNAKQHEREAVIIATAGRPGAVTIATNMAGRGTDIVLGGNLDMRLEGVEDEAKRAEIKREWEQDHQQVLDNGGLYVIGTERHESRRIDNQLRGRSGRQGDPGETRFYLSMDDTLMRIFGSERISNMMQRVGMEEGEAIESRLVSRVIENAQRKVEGHNFDIRKQLLEYDDVANEQRKLVYTERNELMSTDDVSENVESMREEVVDLVIDRSIPAQSMPEQWDIEQLEDDLKLEFGVELPVSQWLADDKKLYEETLRDRILDEVEDAYKAKEAKYGSEIIRHLEKVIMLQTLDTQWKEHLAEMDYLRQGIGLRGYAQKNPKQEYKREAFEMFTAMLERVKTEVVTILAKVQLREESEVGELERRQQEAAQRDLEMQHADAGAQAQSDPNGGGEAAPFVREHPKVGRNEPCPCGSGKKYKQCHGKLT